MCCPPAAGWLASAGARPRPSGPLHGVRRPCGCAGRLRGGGAPAAESLSSAGDGGTRGEEHRAPPSGPPPAPAEGPGQTRFGQRNHLHTELCKNTQFRRSPADAIRATFLRISHSTMSLSVPVTEKATERGGNGRLEYAVSAMQGYRLTMEDAHTALLDLDARTATSFFGVYDGHGGPAVSQYCANHLHTELLKNALFRRSPADAIRATFLRMDVKMRRSKAGRELSEYGGNEYWDEYRQAIQARSCLPLCEKIPYEGPQQDGCTACVVLIRGDQIFVGNAGDSRCVLSRNNQAIGLSTDSKPNLPAERQRIERAGRAVTVTEARGNIPRIDDGIAISRTIGDLAYKNNNRLPPEQQALTALPEVRTANITQDTQFLIIACDGIWDCMESQQAVEFVGARLHGNEELAFICEAILDHCLAHHKGKEQHDCHAGSVQDPRRWPSTTSATAKPPTCRQPW